jgi:hypothetical protein
VRGPRTCMWLAWGHGARNRPALRTAARPVHLLPPAPPRTAPHRRGRNGTLTDLQLAHNDFEGDLAPVAGATLLLSTVHENPKLCGMVPAGVRCGGRPAAALAAS